MENLEVFKAINAIQADLAKKGIAELSLLQQSTLGTCDVAA